MSHSSFLRRFLWLHRGLRLLAITTPREHVLHHAAELQGNYGNSSTLWDRMFGTYLDPERDEHRNPRLGLSYDQDFLGTLTLGWDQALASDAATLQVAIVATSTPSPEADRRQPGAREGIFFHVSSALPPRRALDETAYEPRFALPPTPGSNR